jgi:creatinine amidohydrolase
MTLFPFDKLTYPEVAALPRDVPLVLPLGDGFDLSALPALLGSDDVGLLPAIPFGWQGSGLAVHPQVFQDIAANLAANLLEDGFTTACFLSTQVEPVPGFPTLHLPSIQDIPLLPASGDTSKVVLLPIGHTEQHGYHAPLCTDTVLIEAVAQGTAQVAPTDAVCLPVFPYGVSTHRRSFPGTFNVGGREFEEFWLAVLDVLVARGFTRFYLLSGHGGNSSFLVNVVKYAGEKYPRIFCATSYLYLSGPKGATALETRRQSPLGGMGHACELETSLMMHLRPELVHLERAVDEMDFITTPSYYMDWIEGGALTANPPWEDDTRTGAYGAGSLATAEKGAYWLQVAIEEKVDHVAEIHEQYRRRRERRRLAGVE